MTVEDLKRAHAVWDETTIRYPRVGRRPDEHLPGDSARVVGWKVRDLIRNSHFNEPAGIHHAATWPLRITDVFPASVAIACEGESDMMRVAKCGFINRFYSDVYAIPGATAFANEWAGLFRSYATVYVIPDADKAGGELVKRMGSLIPGLRVVSLPEGEDCCSFLQAHSEDDLWTLISTAPEYVVQEQVRVRRQNWDWKTSEAAEHRDKLTRVVSKDVELKRRGQEFVGRCPFHEEKTPSFSINPKKGLYKCFGCKAAGDVITYLRNKHGLSFGEAMKQLERMN